jgi:DNA invertase Pin-like site-specific DNA recombinase
MRCHTILYVRRSSEEDDRQVLSLDAQIKECRAFAAQQELAISHIISESHSARKPGRPLFEAMLRDARERSEGGAKVRILCHKPDRLLRNLADWARINDLTDAGVELLFVTGSYANNAQGKMAFGVNVLFAKYYVDNLSEEVRKGLNEKIARGEWPAWAPLGYRNVCDRKAPERIVLDPNTAPLVRKAFEYYASGEYSLTTLAVKLAEHGLVGRIRGKRLTRGYLQERILTNPFYCGLMRYRGQLHPGSHPPIISLELFERVQAVLRSVSRPRRIRHHFLWGGLLRCGNCGAAIIGEMKKGKYIYYRCCHHRGPCREGYIREDRLTLLLRSQIRSTVTLRPGAIASLRAAAVRLERRQTSGADEARPALERQVRMVERKLAALLDLRLAGHLTDEQYAAKQAELVREQARARERLRMVELPKMHPREAVDRFIRTCNGVDRLFEEGNDAEIRELLRIVGSNYLLLGGEVNFEPVEPFTLAAQARHCPQWRAGANDVRNIVSLMQVFQPSSAALSGKASLFGRIAPGAPRPAWAPSGCDWTADGRVGSNCLRGSLR